MASSNRQEYVTITKLHLYECLQQRRLLFKERKQGPNRLSCINCKSPIWKAKSFPLQKYIHAGKTKPGDSTICAVPLLVRRYKSVCSICAFTSM